MPWLETSPMEQRGPFIRDHRRTRLRHQDLGARVTHAEEPSPPRPAIPLPVSDRRRASFFSWNIESV